MSNIDSVLREINRELVPYRERRVELFLTTLKDPKPYQLHLIRLF